MFNITLHSKFIHISVLLQNIKDLNKYILCILKKMAKSSDSRQQTEAWTESKMQMISILTKKIQKIKVDQHFMDVDVNDFHMGIHSLVSWFNLLTFKKTYLFRQKKSTIIIIFSRSKPTTPIGVTVGMEGPVMRRHYPTNCLKGSQIWSLICPHWIGRL